MVKYILILCSVAAVQVRASNYLYTTDKHVVDEFTQLLDKVCGYPNLKTLTWRAVMPEQLKDGSWMVIVPDDVYSPEVLKYIDAKTILPKDTKAVVDRKDDIAAALDTASKDPPPTTEKDRLTTVNFILVTQALKDEKLADDKIADDKPVEAVPEEPEK